MKVVIIEDELPAAKRLQKLINQVHPSAQITEVIDSVETAVSWIKVNPAPDLIFMDIQLADGLSFDIFRQAPVNAPVIFTTAFDQYALKAFKVNSVDYLLKPIDTEELHRAFQKYTQHYQTPPAPHSQQTIQDLIAQMTQKTYKERFLVKIGQQLSYVNVKDIAYFYAEEGLVHALEYSNKRNILDFTLDQLEGILAPKHFFRINRKMIINLAAIAKIYTYFNSRLKLDLTPAAKIEVIVSRDRVSDFKQWLDQ